MGDKKPAPKVAAGKGASKGASAKGAGKSGK